VRALPPSPARVLTAGRSMLETPDYPAVARTMRIAPEGAAPDDYEPSAPESTGPEGEDDDAGWGVVKRRRGSPSAPERGHPF
jgi:hypothetical protein